MNAAGPVWLGTAGQARKGVVRRRRAWHGRAGQRAGMDGRGQARPVQVCRGKAWQAGWGQARIGGVRPGKAPRLGTAGGASPVVVRHRMAGQGRPVRARLGATGRGPARQGAARQAWHGGDRNPGAQSRITKG